MLTYFIAYIVIFACLLALAGLIAAGVTYHRYRKDRLPYNLPASRCFCRCGARLAVGRELPLCPACVEDVLRDRVRRRLEAEKRADYARYRGNGSGGSACS